MIRFKDGDIVKCKSHLRRDGIGEPIVVGKTYTVVNTYDNGRKVTFDLYGRSYKSNHFRLVK